MYTIKNTNRNKEGSYTKIYKFSIKNIEYTIRANEY